MNRFLLIVCLLYSAHSYAQDLSRVQKNINILTSKKFHGRGAAKKGDALTAGYINRKFQEMGLSPINGSFIQPFTYDINTFPGKMSLKTNEGVLKTGLDYIVSPTCGTGKGHYPVYYIDTLVFSEESKLDAFLKTNITGFVVVYPKRQLKEFTARTPDLLQHIYSAAAIIQLQEQKLTMGLAGESFGTPVFEVLAASFPKQAKTVSFAVENELIKKHEAKNIIGCIPGTVNKDSFVVVTAHYDHLGTLGKKTYFPGANDNASGVSMMLELAYYYKRHPPAYTLVFIAFAGEESGLIGSSYFVNKPMIDLKSIHFLINLDLLGTGDDGIMVVNGTLFKKQYNSLVLLNEKNALLPAVKMRGEAANSDHYPFFKRQVPCFFIYTLGGITAYHDVKDVASTLPLTRYKQVFSLLVLFVNAQ